MNTLKKLQKSLLIIATFLLFLFDVGIAWIALGVMCVLCFYFEKGKEPRSGVRKLFRAVRRVAGATFYISILLFLIQPWHRTPRIPKFENYELKESNQDIDSSFDLALLLKQFTLDSTERAEVRSQFRNKKYTDTLFNMIKRCIDIEEFEKVTWYSQSTHYRESELLNSDDLLDHDIRFLITNKNRPEIESKLWGFDTLSQEQVIIVNMVLVQAEQLFREQKRSEAVRYLKLAKKLIRLRHHGVMINDVRVTRVHGEKLFKIIDAHLHSISDPVLLRELLTIVDQCRISEETALSSFQFDLNQAFEHIEYREKVSENKFRFPFKLPFQRKLYNKRYTRIHFDYFNYLSLSYISEENQEKRDSLQLIMDDLRGYYLEDMNPFVSVTLSQIIQGNFFGRRFLDIFSNVDVKDYRKDIVEHEEFADHITGIIEERLKDISVHHETR